MGSTGWFSSFLVCSVFLIQNSYARLAPDFIHPCKPDDSVCLKKATQDAIPEFVKGLPELGVPPLDPFVIEKIQISLPGIKVSFYNGSLSGFRKCIMDNVRSSPKKRVFEMEFHCNITLKGSYDAVGRLMIFPINGEGDAKIKIINLKMKVTFITKYVNDDKGVRHFAANNYSYTYEYGDKIIMHMTNIIKGNKELSDTIVAFMNENWRQIAEEFGKPILDIAVEMAVKTIEKFFLAVPFDELIDGEVPVYD